MNEKKSKVQNPKSKVVNEDDYPATLDIGPKSLDTAKAEQQALDFGQETLDPHNRPVECLGMTFENDDARRAYFLEKLRERLRDPEFRKIEGFPIGSDEDILALSDPPYYTACPNPFIADFIKHYGKPYDPSEPYSREPFAVDVSEGKTDPIYNAHSYHTKVPHKAIMRYILHYTEPGDVVFDGFCGTGMTGVAAKLCGDRSAISSLGYPISKDGSILDEDKQPFSRCGERASILNDLSPAATLIAAGYNVTTDSKVRTAGTCPTRTKPETWRSYASGRCSRSSRTTGLPAKSA